MPKKQFIKRIFSGLGLFLFLLIVLNLDLLSYGWMQLQGQLRVMNESRPIEEYLADPNFPDSLKQKINLIQEVKSFAIDSLGLKSSKNYTTLFDQKNKPILWNVSACKPYSFEEKKWGFPVIGSFSYKGFFDLNKASALEKELIEEGWDVRLRTVGGWSTLGWFKDPILSNMLKRGDGRLAELIIHELTHATLFVKGDATMNENLATFVGEKGAIAFMKWKYGASSDEMTRYINAEEDYLKFSEYMLTGADRLDSLYQTFQDDTSEVEKETKKQAMIKTIVAAIDSIGLTSSARYKRIFEKKMPNNAYFSSYRRYRSKQATFSLEYQQSFGGDFLSYLSHLKSKYAY